MTATTRKRRKLWMGPRNMTNRYAVDLKHHEDGRISGDLVDYVTLRTAYVTKPPGAQTWRVAGERRYEFPALLDVAAYLRSLDDPTLLTSVATG